MPTSESQRRVFIFEATSQPSEAAAAAERLLGPGWRVEQLFPPLPGDPPGLSRFLRAVQDSPGRPVPSRQAWQEARELRGHEAFASVRPDLPTSVFAPPGEELSRGGAQQGHLPGSLPPEWARRNIRADSLGEQGHHGRGILIAHPDTGYTAHPALGTEHLDLSRDADLLAGDDDAKDPLERFPLLPLYHPGHGTSTGGVIAARRHTSLPGVAPEATLIPIRTMKSVVQVFDSDVARAIHHARRVGAHIISMSLGGVGFTGVREALDVAVAQGLVVMAAAGNYEFVVVYPARYPNCIAVAANNCEDRPWWGSARGSSVLVCAPGESVHCANYVFGADDQPEPRQERHAGTSFAVAHLAGACALWLAHHGREALVQRYGAQRLQSLFIHLVRHHGHRRPAGWDTRRFGVGILDVAALLEAPLPTPEEIAPVSPRPGPAPAERLAELLGPLPERLQALSAAPQGEELLAELLFLAAEHPGVRTELRAPSPQRVVAPRGAVSEHEGREADGLLRELASPPLWSALEGR